MYPIKNMTTLMLLTFVSACGGSSAENPAEPVIKDPVPIVDQEEPEALSDIKIKLNQVGFLPNESKMAIVPNVSSNIFELVDAESKSVVFEGTLSLPLSWNLSGAEEIKQADFSSFNTSGTYIIQVKGVSDSSEFDINNNVYSPLHDAALKFYYFNRASQEIDVPYAEKWPRAAGHLDNQVKIHSSAASERRPTATIISSPKGWYDAGDYGKYVVNSGISTYTLLAAYEHYPFFYQNRHINIPESDDSIPDILNEIHWNVDWLASMQDLDGSVYHKLTTLDWPGQEMPDEDQRDRYVIGKSTSAALNFAAVLAKASRVYQPFETYLPGKSEQWLSAAIAAWNWAIKNPAQYYQQPADVSSGEYGDNSVDDEFAWAAAELFITTKNVKYLNQFRNYRNNESVPSWDNVSYLALSTLLMNGETLMDSVEFQSLKTSQLALANTLVEYSQNNSYRVAMVASDFVWGSNAVAMNKALVLMQAYEQSNENKFRNAALHIVDYVLGRNPTGYSFVTGFGVKTPMSPHHRVSDSDNIKEPIPGMLVGGPHSGRQDQCKYDFLEPAKSYLDDWCSFSTNEVTINWNAPLVYVLASMQNE